MIKNLINNTIITVQTDIGVIEDDKDILLRITTDNGYFDFIHLQEGFEDVWLEEGLEDLQSMIGCTILASDEFVSHKEIEYDDGYQWDVVSSVWTFYNISSTHKATRLKFVGSAKGNDDAEVVVRYYPNLDSTDVELMER